MKVFCKSCKREFSNFLFYTTMGGLICLVRCRQCRREIHLPGSTYFFALFAWMIISGSVLFCTSKVIQTILSEPEMIRTLVLISGAIVGLTVGGFFASQVILNWISKNQ